jgi:hypothetical protein
MRIYAAHNNLPLENNTPVTDETFFKKFRYHKINIKDQWASHPPREERTAHLEKLNVAAAKDTREAWVLFNNAGELQQQLTAFLYKNVTAETKQHIDAAAFKEQYEQDISSFQLPPEYNGFFENRQLNDMNLDNVMNSNSCSNIIISAETFSSLFTEDWCALVKNLEGNEQDVLLLNAIIEKKIITKSFDYDGQKMKRAEANSQLEKLNEEIRLQQQQLQQHDELIAAFFYKAATINGEAAASLLKEKYEQHCSMKKLAAEFINSGQKMMDLLAPIFSGQSHSIPQAIIIARGLREESSTLRPLIKELMKNGVYAGDAEMYRKAEEFTSTQFEYFNQPRFSDYQLSILHQLLNGTVQMMGTYQFKNFKLLLEYQLDLYKKVMAA